MDDLHRIWNHRGDRAVTGLDTPSGSLRILDGLQQYLVSGDLDAASAELGFALPGVGAMELAHGNGYAVRLGRDRVLIVAPAGQRPEPGWHEQGYAVSDMSALGVFEIEGLLSESVVSRATTLPVTGTGPSAAVSFAGTDACLYRHDRPDRVRLHVDPSLIDYLWTWLETCVKVTIKE